jgi:hypothetical protein
MATETSTTHMAKGARQESGLYAIGEKRKNVISMNESESK